jgi:hypothetical protein
VRMTIAVLVACLLTAMFCGFELDRIRRGLWIGRRRFEDEEFGADRPNEWEFPVVEHAQLRDRLARRYALTLVASLTLAAATAVLDAKVSEAGDRSPPRTSHELPGSSATEELSIAERAAFRGKVTRHHEVPRRTRGGRLCLMRYAERTFGKARLSGRWWTSCRKAEHLVAVVDVKEELALPARFGAIRDARIKAVIPAGARVVYYEGLVAPQCEHEHDSLPCRGHRYQGGGWQYTFPRPTQLGKWISGAECTRVREDRPSRWTPCVG